MASRFKFLVSNKLVAPAGFEPASPDPESFYSSNTPIIDFQRVKKVFYSFLKNEVSEPVAERYYAYLEQYLTKPITKPSELAEIIDIIRAESRGGKLRWFSAGEKGKKKEFCLNC